VRIVVLKHLSLRVITVKIISLPKKDFAHTSGLCTKIYKYTGGLLYE